MRTERSSGRPHDHVTEWAIGNGVKTEFFLDHTVGRVTDLQVFVDGLLKRPKDRATAYDYKIRGLSAGYDGDKNAITFTAAPGAVNIAFVIITT